MGKACVEIETVLQEKRNGSRLHRKRVLRKPWDVPFVRHETDVERHNPEMGGTLLHALLFFVFVLGEPIVPEARKTDL